MHHKKRPPKVYIHYGNDTFIPSHVCQPQRWDKPSGLWASPISAGWGWKDFIHAEWNSMIPTLATSFCFQLKKGTKILKVKTMQDIFPYLKYRKPDFEGDRDYELDHEKLRREFDGLELFYSGKFNFHDTRLFWSWDCDSLVLWNTAKIQIIK